MALEENAPVTTGRRGQDGLVHQTRPDRTGLHRGCGRRRHRGAVPGVGAGLRRHHPGRHAARPRRLHRPGPAARAQEDARAHAVGTRLGR
ncbi:hypothetical protein G6F45_014071 [Rhizopus arrhizus]|nr:hypothetical protein G6F45_014071 [Rhizopus arrhizus]